MDRTSKQAVVKGKAAEAWMLSDLLLGTLQEMVDEVGEGCRDADEASDRLKAFLGEKQTSGLEGSLRRLVEALT